MPDKILVTNCAALGVKYGEDGLREVIAALRALIVADKDRGITTELVDLSDKTRMKAFRCKPVSSLSERQHKDAVDAISKTAQPNYLVLVDGPDVIPHLTLNNPASRDGDAEVPSDLPYASDARYTSRDPAKYAAVTRVVGRIPGVTGAARPDFLVKQLKAAASYKSKRRSDYLAYFAVSARPWHGSTVLSIENIFRKNAIKDCPPTKSPAVRRLLAPLSHFINCHGAEVDPHFYGQKGNSYPIAMSSSDVTSGVKRDAIVAAECCYGAQLFDPQKARNILPISNSYLDKGAIAFLGSTTIAYGGEDNNSAADLLAQYFLINILGGASFGRAFLQARQKFVQGQKMEDHVNLKTLAQFVLLSDPSLQPCRDVGPLAEGDPKFVDAVAARKVRRVALAAAGQAAVDCSGFPSKRVARPPRHLHDQVRSLARKRGFRAHKDNVSFFDVAGGVHYRSEMKARGVKQNVAVIVEHRRTVITAETKKRVRETRIFVAHAQNNRVTQVAEYVSR